MRRGLHFSIALIVILSLISSRPVLANLPQEYQFDDPEGDSLYTHTTDTQTIEYPISDDFFADILHVGYNLDRATGQLTFVLEFQDVPIINNSAFYAMSIEFENGLNKIALRTFYGTVGLTVVNEVASLDIFVQIDNSIDSETQELELSQNDNSIQWIFTPTVVDIVAAFDNPNLLLSRVTAEMEYSVNGSSLFAERGDYYKDEFVLNEFDFAGAVQGIGSQGGIFDIIDPFTLSLLSLGIPLIIGTYRLARRIRA